MFSRPYWPHRALTSAALVTTLVTTLGARPALAAPLAMVTEVQGNATLTRDGKPQALKRGQQLEAGDKISVASGKITIYSLQGPPITLKAGQSVELLLKASGPPVLWKSVYNSVAQGFSTRNKQVAGAMRPGTVEALTPGPGVTLEARPLFTWSAAALDAAAVSGYQLTIKTAAGATVHQTRVATTQWRPPEAMPALQGDLLWQVTPLGRPAAAPGHGEMATPVAEWASAPTTFHVATTAEKTAIEAGLTAADQQTVKLSPEEQALARAAVLLENRCFDAAAAVLEPVNTETARLLLRTAYLQSGRANQVRALDALERTEIAVPPLAPELEAAPVLALDEVAPDARRRFVTAEGLALDVPSRWGVQRDAIPGGTLYQFAYQDWPRISLAVMEANTPAATPVLENLLANVKAQGALLEIQGVDTTHYYGRPAKRALWVWRDAKGSYQGESLELSVGGRRCVYSTAATSREEATFQPAKALGGTLTPAPNEPATPWQEVKSPDELTKLYQTYLEEMKAGVAAAKEVTDNATRRNTAEPGKSEAVLGQADAAPAGSMERALLAQQASLYAGARAWEATEAGKETDAARWLQLRGKYAGESYASLKAHHLEKLAAMDSRLAELGRTAPSMWTGSSVSILTDILLDLQIARAGDLMECARNAGDNATEEQMARRRLKDRRATLAPANLIPGSDINRLRTQVLDCLGELGYVAESRADYDTARSIYRRCVALRRELNLPPSQARVDKPLRDLAAMEMRIGNQAAAEAGYRETVQVLEASKAGRDAEVESARKSEEAGIIERGLSEILVTDYWQGLAVAHNNLGTLVQARGDLRLALQHFDTALQLADKIPTGGFSGRIRANTRTRTLSNRAVLQADSGNWEAARVAFTAALAEQRAMGDDSQAAVTQLNLAAMLEMEGKTEDARRMAQSARQVLLQNRLFKSVVTADTFLARLDWQAGNTAQAAQTLAGVLNMARERKDPESTGTAARLLAKVRLDMAGKARPLTAAQLEPAWQAWREAEAAEKVTGVTSIANLVAKADIQAAGGDTQAATESLAAAILRLESMRATAVSESQFSESEDNFTPYRKIVELLLKAGRPDEAFDYLSRARSRQLQENFRLANLKSPDPAVQRLLERATQLDARLRTVRGQLESEKARPAAEQNTAKVEQLQNLVAATQAEFFAVSNGIKEKFPAYEKVISVKPRELRKAQRALPQGAALLQYAPLGESLYIFVVTRDDLKIFNPPVKPKELQEKIRAYRKLMEEAGTQIGQSKTPEPGGALQACSRELYAMLIAPVQSVVDAAETVAIIPTGELYYLPFHALQREVAGKAQYLVEQKAVAFLAAADVMAVVQDRTAMEWGQGLLALGDPAGAELPEAAAEVKAIAGIYPNASALTGAQATKAALTGPAGTGRRILHLATHGVLNPLQPDQSYIQLAKPPGVPEDKAQEASRLRLAEVYGLKLDGVDLVTLSACRTALGEGQPDGSEITSLAESFSSAGSPSVVATLWSVEDRSTRLLMEEFYTQLSGGKGKATALRQAQLKLLQDPRTAHPYFWAPFELLGDWR